jgi:hypothetical protein
MMKTPMTKVEITGGSQGAEQRTRQSSIQTGSQVSMATPASAGAYNAIAAASPQVAQLNAYAAIANGGAAIQRQAAPQGGLPSQLKSGIESLSGIGMDDVRVHYNSAKPAQLQAHAYAQGAEIHVAPGQERHLAHEAWHVVQQKQGRVKPTLQLKGVAINDDSALEREADTMGAQAIQVGSSHMGAPRLTTIGRQSQGRPESKQLQRQSVANSPVQRTIIYGGNFLKDNEPEVTMEYESYEAHSKWEDAQKGLATYLEGDKGVKAVNDALGPLFAQFEAEPNLDVLITSGEIKDAGQTTFSVWDGTKYCGIAPAAPNKLSSKEWPKLVTAGNYVRMEITISANLTFAQIMHTLNHELSLHAASDFKLIQTLRKMKHPTMAVNYVESTMFKMGVHSGDYAHAQLGADKDPRLKATHAAMKTALGADKVSIAALDKDYATDVADHKKYVPAPFRAPRPLQLKAATTPVPADTIQLAKNGQDAQAELAAALQDYDEDRDAADEYEGEEEDDLTPLIAQEEKRSCGIAAVQMALYSKNKVLTPEQVQTISRDYPGAYSAALGISMDNMAKIINGFTPCVGPKVLPLFKVIAALQNGPVIARVEGAAGHFVVIDSVEGEAPVYDGARGVRREGTRVLHIRDPWPVDAGAHVQVTEEEFQKGGGALQTSALYIHF